MFRRFGASVSIVQRGDRLLPREDEDVSSAILEIFRQDDIEVLLSSNARSVARTGEGTTEIRVTTPDGERDLNASELLIAVGRTPNSDSLNVEAAGLEVE